MNMHQNHYDDNYTDSNCTDSNCTSNNFTGRIARVCAMTASSFLILLPLLFLLNIGASSAASKGAERKALAVADAAAASLHQATPESAAADCSTVTNVPTSECLALVALYSSTNGTDWLTKTHWLQFGANAPCGWYGVVCNGGHVRQLLLAGNRLSGTLPLALGNLPALERLRLENNALVGRVPPTICKLTELTDLNLAYNALFSQHASVQKCLEPLAAEWRATQTTPVRDLRVIAIYTETLRLEWTPIAYTDDGGYYEIGVATQQNGPYTLHGTTVDKNSALYTVTGLSPGTPYYIRVRSYTPPHDDQQNHVRSLAAQAVGVTKALSGSVLVAAFFSADNDLAPNIPYVIERMRRGTEYNPNVQVVLLVDARRDGDTRLLEIANGEVISTNVVMQEWGMDELDMGDPAVLAWFLRYARDHYPAEREVAAIIGHGIALAPEIEWPDTAATAAGNTATPTSGKIPPLPKEHDYSPSDVTNRGYMSAVDVGKALMEATDNGADPFDVIFFDQCFQGSLEVLYEVRNSAHIFVASPNYAWLVAAYDRYLTRFVPSASPQQLARAIIEHYEASLDPRHPNAIFWIRNSDLLAIAAQISALGDALIAAVQANEHSKIASAVQQSEFVDTTQCGDHNLQLGPPDELIGIENFGMGLQTAFGAGDPYGISDTLSALQPLMLNVAKRSIAGKPYIAPDQVWDYSNSLTLLAPLPRNSPPTAAWRASIYRADMPFQATWTVDPSQPVTVTEGLAFVRDFHWDEFLDVWYFNLAPTVGQWCHYIPPVQVAVSETGSLSLTASIISSDSLALEWTSPDESTAIEYWLYGRDPYAISWRVEQVIALTQSSLTITGLDPGTYHYMVVARDEEQLAVANSNPVTVTMTEEMSVDLPTPLLLPLVMRD